MTTNVLGEASHPKLYIDVEGPRPGRICTPTPVVVLDSDTPPTFSLSYDILGYVDACQRFVIHHRVFLDRLLTEQRYMGEFLERRKVLKMRLEGKYEKPVVVCKDGESNRWDRVIELYRT